MRRGKIISLSLLLACLSSVAFLFCLAFAMDRFSVGEQAVRVFIFMIYGISCFLGGFLAGKKGRTRKYLWGACTGAAYVVFLMVASCLISRGFSLSVSQAAMALPLCAGAGMAGGMVS